MAYVIIILLSSLFSAFNGFCFDRKGVKSFSFPGSLGSNQSDRNETFSRQDGRTTVSKKHLGKEKIVKIQK